MNGRCSPLGQRIQRKYKDRINEINKHGSIIGQRFEIDGKTYVITDGEVNFEKQIEQINKMINNL